MVVNILFANMSEIQKTVIGSMFVQLQGTDSDINDAVHYLRQNGVQVSEIHDWEIN